MGPLRIALVFVGQEEIGPVPYGVISLGAILEQAGHRVEVHDYDGRSVDDASVRRCCRTLTGRGATLIGITTITAPSLRRVVRACELYRQLLPDATIVLGGMHASIFPEAMLRELPVDAVAVGEADLSILEIARAAEGLVGWELVRGVVFRRGDDIVKNPPAAMVTDMHQLPRPAWHLVDVHRHSYVYLIESYGCPYRCAFCYNHLHERYRSKSPETVVKDLRHLYEHHGIRMVKIWDDQLFGANKRLMLDFCERLGRERMKLGWSCFIRPQLIDEEVADAMCAAGCFRMAMGVESGSPRMLELLNKANTVERVARTFEILHRPDLITAAAIMLGLPGEERADLDATLRHAREIRATEYFVPNYKPYPGTKLYADALAQGFQPPQSTLGWADYSDFAKYAINCSKLPLAELVEARRSILALSDRRKYVRLMSRQVLRQFAASPAREFWKFSRIVFNRGIGRHFIRPRRL